MHEGALMETASVGAGAVGGVATDCYPPLSAIRSDPPLVPIACALLGAAVELSMRNAGYGLGGFSTLSPADVRGAGAADRVSPPTNGDVARRECFPEGH